MKMKHHDAHEAARAVATFLILFVALGVFFLFKEQKDFLFASNSVQTFLLLTIAGFGCLIFLGFLIHKGDHNSASKKKKK